MIHVELIGATRELNIIRSDIKRDPFIFAGKAAGECYSKDGFYGDSNRDEQKVIKRAQQHGGIHQSIHDHYYINFEMILPKFMCMLLNSIGVYNTSEKSARYTKMEPESTIEQDMYDKWQDLSVQLLTPYLSKYKTAEEIKKLGQENARYMISVWTPTRMIYSITYRNAILLVDHLLNLANRIGSRGSDLIKPEAEYDFWRKLALTSRELAGAICEQLEIESGDLPIGDIKNQDFRFLENTARYIYSAYDEYDNKGKMESIRDSYTLRYKLSFAGLAQAERHRTLRYSFYMGMGKEKQFYIPFYVKNTMMEQEWLHDINEINKKTTVQGELLYVTEQGIVEDFVLKAKERLCGRAQNEIRQITVESMKKFHNEMIRDMDRDVEERFLSHYTTTLLENCLRNGEVIPRCQFGDFECKEPCYMGVNGLLNC